MPPPSQQALSADMFASLPVPPAPAVPPRPPPPPRPTQGRTLNPHGAAAVASEIFAAARSSAQPAPSSVAAAAAAVSNLSSTSSQAARERSAPKTNAPPKKKQFECACCLKTEEQLGGIERLQRCPLCVDEKVKSSVLYCSSCAKYACTFHAAHIGLAWFEHPDKKDVNILSAAGAAEYERLTGNKPPHAEA